MGARQAVVLGEQGRAENSKGNLGMKEEILLGCSIWEQSPGGSCSVGRRGFLAWTYAHTQVHHVQDTAGLLHLLNISGKIVIIILKLMQGIKGGKNESAGVSKGGALLILTQGMAGTWSCWIRHNNINTRSWSCFYK